MTAISRMTAIDPRSDWDKISRRQMWRGAKNLGIPFPVGATHEAMMNIFIAAGKSPHEVANFVPVKVPTEAGNEKVVMYPEEKERVYDEEKENRRIQEFERRIEEGIKKDKAEKERLAAKDAEIESIKTEVNDIKEMLGEIMQALPKSPVAEEPPPVKAETKNLNQVHWKTFQKMAKEAGFEWTTKDPREPIIEKLNG